MVEFLNGNARVFGQKAGGRGSEPEVKLDPKVQHELNMAAIEKFRAGRRARGVVEGPPKKVPRIRD